MTRPATGCPQHDYALMPVIWSRKVGNAWLAVQRQGCLRTTSCIASRLGSSPCRWSWICNCPARLSTTGEFSKALKLMTYNAAFVWLARRRELSVAMLDTRLRELGSGLNLSVLG